ncbi:hypothetical protein Goshw_018798 [Gossypium schwendimanii]|uniref:Pathogenesis-related protein 1 n=1 Tax=Gossypium schwendimanii TaxID=34291 RepID=A0A7J9KTD2_GOSSC|nr:hypothetical protein [Gossypium schwendimanii]
MGTQFSVAICLMAFTLAYVSLAQNPSNEDYLNVHNAARAEVGVGPLTWDATVAAYAQQYASKRIADCDLIHSTGPYGENLAEASYALSGAEAVTLWVDEKPHYNYDANQCVGGECLHYTQVVWRNSTRLGCARVKCNSGWWFVTCNYDPPGNIGRFFSIVEPTYVELTLEFCSTFVLQHVMSSHDESHAITFRLGATPHYLGALNFVVALGLYSEEFMNGATSLPPVLRYIHAVLDHTLTGQGKSIGVVGTFDTYFLWSMATRGPYVTHLARHFDLLDTLEKSSSFTLVGQMVSQGLSIMSHMRMIERQYGVGPPQYRLSHSNPQDEYEDFSDDVPFHHEDPPYHPPLSHPTIVPAVTLADLYEWFTHFEQH